MSLARFSVGQPVLVNLLALAVLVGGAMAVSDIPREATPAVPMGAAQIFAAYPGASAAEVEQLVGLPLESAIRGLPDVRHVYTTSREGMAMLWVELSPNTADVSRAVMRVQSAVEGVPQYPSDAPRPIVRERTVMVPTLTVALAATGAQTGDGELADASDTIQRLLEQVPGVSEVQASGLGERALFVHVDPDRLQAFQLPLEAVAEALAPRGQDVPAGVVELDSQARLVRGVTRATTPEEVRQIVVRAHPAEARVRIEDVATVSQGALEPPVSARVDGQAGALLMVYRRADADSIRVSEAVHSMLAESAWRWPEGVRAEVRGDLAPGVRRNLGTLYENAAVGLLLVVLLLWAFVGGRNAIMTALGLPVALAGAAVAMVAMGVTLNSLSLMALILCLGIVVDDAIILVENIYRHMEEGASPVDAAIRGTEEVMMPVVASTVTTCAAFAPLFYMTGVFGEFFSIIPKVVVAALVASLAEALVVLPSHMADHGGRPDTERSSGPGADPGEVPQTRLQRLLQRTNERMLGGYLGVLEACLRRPGTVVFVSYVACALLIATAYRFKEIVLMNDGDVDAIDVRVRMPAESSRAATERVMREIDARILALHDPDVAELQSTTGYSRTDTWTVTGDHVGMSSLRLVDPEVRSSATAGQGVLERVQEALQDVVGPEWLQATSFELGPPRGASFALRVTGDSHDGALEAAEAAMSALRQVPGVRAVSHDAGLGKLEVSVIPDEERAAHHGLRSADIVRWLRLSLAETTVARTRQGDQNVRLIVGLAPDALSDPASLGALRLMTPTGGHVALSEVAELRSGRSVGVLHRRDGEQQLQVTADVDESMTSTQDVADAFAALQPSIEREHPRAHFVVGGELEQVHESLNSLLKAFILAALLIYAVLATQFQSFLQPLIVMAAIPLSLIGVVVGFFITNQPIGIIALVGVVGLAGIVVNDSLVLVEFINTRRRAGAECLDAVREAGRLRLRPILVTSVTTVAGLLPLAFAGGSAPMLAPMAAAISWGLTFATGLTLVAVPCLYVLVDRVTTAWSERSIAGERCPS